MNLCKFMFILFYILGKLGYFPTDYVEKLPLAATTMVQPIIQPMVSNQTVSPLNRPLQNNLNDSMMNTNQPLNLQNQQPMVQQKTVMTSNVANPKVMAKVLYEFKGTGPNEMKLSVGEVIEVVTQGPRGGWSKGVRGAFPTDYVEFLPAAVVPQSATVPDFLSSPSTSTSFTPAVAKPKSALNSQSNSRTVAAANINDPSNLFAGIQKSNNTSNQSDLLGLSDVSSAFGNMNVASNQKSAKSSTDLFDFPVATTSSNNSDLLDLNIVSNSGTSNNSFSSNSSAAMKPQPFLKQPSLVQSSSIKADIISSVEWPTETSVSAAPVANKSSSNPFDDESPRDESKPVFTATTSPASKSSAPNNLSSSNNFKSSSAASSMPTSNVGNTKSNVEKPPQPVAPPPTPMAPPSSSYARVKYTRAAGSPTELSITVNDILLVLKKDSDWWYGSVHIGAGTSDKNIGYFPGNYVEEISDAEVSKLSVSKSTSVSTSSMGSSTTNASVSRSTPVKASASMNESSMPTSTSSLTKTSVGPARKLPTRITQNTSQTGASITLDYALETIDKDKLLPVWLQPFFSDLFADEYKRTMEDVRLQAAIPAVHRFRHAFHVVRSALSKVSTEDEIVEGMREILVHVLGIFREGYILCENYPIHSNDPARFHTFLAGFMQRIRNLAESETMIFPCSWVSDDGLEYGIIVVVTKNKEEGDDNFSVALINTNDEKNGLNYHPFVVDPSDGSVLRSLTLELTNIPSTKILSTAFWFMVFKSSILANGKIGNSFYYDKAFPFLVQMPLASAHQAGIDSQAILNDFGRVPQGGDYSFIHCALECIRYLARLTGLTFEQSQHMVAMTKWNILEFVRNDLGVGKELSKHELELIRVATRSTAKAVGLQIGRENTLSASHIAKLMNTISIIDENIATKDDAYNTAPVFDLIKDEQLKDIGVWNWFGRFRREFDVEPFAGDAPVHAILRPVEMTLVPEKVNSFHEVACAMRHAVHLCVLLSNQQTLIRNTYTLRFCLIEHLFIRVIPLPLPINHADREKRCFWHAQDMRYETQADIMRLLSMLCRHFAAVSLSIKMTRSGDALRMLIFACMATIGDACMRKVATDIPSQASLHYSGKANGPVRPFGFDMGNFAEESEYLKFSSAEAATARTQVLDYFFQLKKEIDEFHLIFNFDKTSECSGTDRIYIDQLCLQMGFPRNSEPFYITGMNPLIIENYPEVMFFRDIVFMFKLVMVPTSDKLPELSMWTATDARLGWTYEEKTGHYIVTAFNRKLDCVQNTVLKVEEQQVKQATKRKGFFAYLFRLVGVPQKSLRSIPSQANPSILLGERVDTEDDILHIRTLPDFDGTLGARDCELMLQYLLAPYMRIPLLLHFFSFENRLKALRNRQLQEVLDAAMFEPGQFQEENIKEAPTVVPADSRSHLCTSAGLLFNEILMSPNIILAAIQVMLERVIDMDTGKFSELGESILYVVRLAVRVEGYLLFLVRNFEFHKKNKNQNGYTGAYYESIVRGLQNVDEGRIKEALQCQKNIRQMLDEKVFKIIARWIRKSKDDRKMHQACILHAHLAFLYRNVEKEDLNCRIVFSTLASQIFLFTNYKYDLDVDISSKDTKKTRKDADDYKTDLVIPQVELFSMFQRNRRMLLEWLEDHPSDRNAVMDAIVQLIEEGAGEKDVTNISRKWIAIEHSGLNFKGRFVPENEFDKERFLDSMSPRALKNFETWLRETTTLAVNTEINVQLGEFTIKKNATRPLESDMRNNDDFDEVLSNLKGLDIIQCAEVKNAENRQWVRLVGLGYDLQLWNSDTRRAQHGYKKPYSLLGTKWVKEILDPWKDKILPGMELFYDIEDPNTVNCLVLYCNTSTSTVAADSSSDTLKEIVVYRYPKVFHIYNIVEHGRYWYRHHIFSSNPMFSLTDMKTEAFQFGGKLFVCCGNPTLTYNPGPSLVVIRYMSEESNNTQTNLPRRYLQGIIPSALVDTHTFWQNSDDSITGYLNREENNSAANSILKIKLQKLPSKEPSEFGMNEANAIIKKVFVSEEFGKNSKDWMISNPPVDDSKQPLYMVNLLSIVSHYYGLLSGDQANLSRYQVAKECSALHLLPNESKNLHCLVRLMLRLDSISHILAWSKTNPEATIDPSTSKQNVKFVHALLSIDFIELPRLRLTFEKRFSSDGSVRYYCLEQNGLFLAGYEDNLKFGNLIDGLANAILLTNVDNEYYILLPAIAKPALVRSKVNRQGFQLVYNRSDPDWIANTGEATYFVYPLHTSGCFMSSRSVASTLYLLLLRLMTRRYVEAFRLIESSICDTTMSSQEKQIYDIIIAIKDDLLADSHACRLKLFFVSYGCRDMMPFNYSFEDEMLAYANQYYLVSAQCRLTIEEEIFIMSLIPTNHAIRKFPILTNRERIIKSSFDTYLDKYTPKISTRSFVPIYPPIPETTPFNRDIFDLDALDPNKPNFKTLLQKLTIVKYSKPEPITGAQAIEFISNIVDTEKSLGFFLLYDLMTNQANIKILNDDTPHSLGAVLLRFLTEANVGGVQHVILRVMETHPALAMKMPIFEDKRKYKIPTFAGLDTFQTHIRAAAAFIKSNSTEVVVDRLIYKIPYPTKLPETLQAALTVDMSPDKLDGRQWIVPKVTDYNLENREVSSTYIPSHLEYLSSVYNSDSVKTLCTYPLNAINLEKYVDFRTRMMRNDPMVSSQSPLRVLNHPSSRSHIARTTVQRLEKDIADYASDENNNALPVLRIINSQQSSLSGQHLNDSIIEMNAIINSLNDLRQKDTKIIKDGVSELLDFTNGVTQSKLGHDVASGFQALHRSGYETYLEFDFLSACTATADTRGDLSLYNIFLTDGDIQSIMCCTMFLMMSSNRVSHATLAIQQARNVVKLLQELQKIEKNANSDKDNAERIKKELLSLSDTLAVTLTNKRYYTVDRGQGVYQMDPRFLLFEFCHGLVLRQAQVKLVHKLLDEIKNGRSVCNQMIMGAGKTTVVGPLLAMLMANAQTLVFEVVPPALLYFSASVLRERFSAAIRKPVFTFQFDRYSEVTPELLFKLRTARNLRAVVVASPTAIKSFTLKFIEQCHNLNRQKNIVAEKDILARNRRYNIRALLGLSDSKTISAGEMNELQLKSARNQADICEKILNIFQSSVEIMDEVDIILHPLKSELNWPLGAKEPLDFTRSRSGNGLRWGIPSHLLDAIFCCTGMPILADIADSKIAKEILDELDLVIRRGFDTLQLLRSPHLVVVSKNFYDSEMKMPLMKWLLLWLRARKVPTLTDAEIIEFLGSGNRCSAGVLQKMKNVLGDDHVKMLNLGFDWINSYLPFVLQKVNRVSFGLLQEHDIEQLEADGVKIPTSRKLTAVPFVAKDVPSRSSEFAHPDVLIGLTVLAFRYEGLRKNDFHLVLRHLRDTMEEEGGLYKDRPSCQKFETWVLAAGKAIRGSKKREKNTTRKSHNAAGGAVKRKSIIIASTSKSSTIITTGPSGMTVSSAKETIDIFNDIFSEDDDLIWPLQLIDLKDKEQFRVLYPLLYKLPHAVMHFLNELIFPEVLAHQGLKLSTCGQELGGDILFSKRIGFSGTPSDILPLELGSCQYERGSDGCVVHYLTSPSVVSYVNIANGWDVFSLLDYIATVSIYIHSLSHIHFC